MLRTGYRTPAQIRQAFLLFGAVVLGLQAAPPSKSSRPPPDFVQVGTPDQEKGGEILREFRGMGIAGDYYLEFELRVMPRRGNEQVFRGQLWGSRNVSGPISRVVIFDAQGHARRLLIQNGSEPKIWICQEGQPAPEEPSPGRLFESLLPETELTPFDLQMPYLYWNDFVFEGVSKVMGRAAHTFLLYPPENVTVQNPSLSGVRVDLDTQFHALVRSTLLDAENNAAKTLTVRDLKKINDQWMVKVIDLRNEKTRDKSRFQITRAALNLDLSPRVFSPEALNETIVAPEQTVSLGR